MPILVSHYVITILIVWLWHHGILCRASSVADTREKRYELTLSTSSRFKDFIYSDSMPTWIWGTMHPCSSAFPHLDEPREGVLGTSVVRIVLELEDPWRSDDVATTACRVDDWCMNKAGRVRLIGGGFGLLYSQIISFLMHLLHGSMWVLAHRQVEMWGYTSKYEVQEVRTFIFSLRQLLQAMTDLFL